MTNTPTVQETSKALANPEQLAGVVAPHIGADDFVAAKILCLHSQSKKAKDKQNEAEAGEFRDTVENRLFGSTEHPFQFLPIHMISFWVVYDVTGGGQGKYVEQFPVDASNENLRREETVGGKKLKRVKTYECYVLIPEEIEAGAAFPYVLSFRITSSRGGKTLLTQMYVKNKAANRMPYATVCELSATEESNEHGDFYVQHTRPVRVAKENELKEAERWYKMIVAGQVKKDDSDLEEGGGHAMDAAQTTQF